MAVIAVRWSGWLLVAGAALFGTAIVILSLNPDLGNQQLPRDASALFLLSSIFLLLSLPAMYATQANSAGWLGLVGFALLQPGVILFVLVSATPLVYPSVQTPPGENAAAFLLGIALTAGLLLTGVATIRAKVFPRWSGILLLTAMGGFFFAFFVSEFLGTVAAQLGTATFGLLLAAAFAGTGLAMWRIAGIR